MEEERSRDSRSQDLLIKRSDLRQIREEYLNERRLLVEAEHKAIGGYDKAMLTLSAGALGFSISYVEMIAPNITGQGWLLATWITFAISAVLTAVSMYESHKAFREAQVFEKQRFEIISSDYLENYGKPHSEKVTHQIERDDELIRCIDFLNSASLVFFIGGAFCLIVFSWLNLGN